MHPLIAQHLPAITAICQRYQIRRLDVFGSASSGDDFDLARSDADFLVEFVPGARTGLDEFFGAKAELERLLGRTVDLVEPSAVRNPFVKQRMNRHRELVYGA